MSSPGGPPSAIARQRRAESTRHRLLVAAGRRFAESGYHGTALRDLLDGSDVTKGALYFHFPSKEALARALVETMDSSWHEVIPAVRRRTADPLRVLVVLTDVLVARMDDPIAAGGARILRDGVLGSPSLAERTDALEGDCERLLDEAAACGVLLPAVCPRWVAHELVMSFAGRRTLTGSRTHLSLGDQMDDFWAGMLPLIATPDWIARWRADDGPGRPRPACDGLASLSPAVVAAVDAPAARAATP